MSVFRHKCTHIIFCVLLSAEGPLYVMGEEITVKPILVNGTYINPELGKYHARLRTLSQSCRDIKEKYKATTGEFCLDLTFNLDNINFYEDFGVF